jgi:hypothetical protein
MTRMRMNRESDKDAAVDVMATLKADATVRGNPEGGAAPT